MMSSSGGVAPGAQPTLQLLERWRQDEHEQSLGIGSLDLAGTVILDVEKHILTAFDVLQHCSTWRPVQLA